jgi:Holliday junction resolvase RusA-like endonuclease
VNPYLARIRKPILAYLGLEELETVRTRIKCDTSEFPEVLGAMRPRMDTRGGHPHMHNAPRHQKALDYIAGYYESARGKLRGSFEGPVIFSLVSHRHIPKSWPKRRHGEQDTMKPDASNILKLVEDALNGIAYKDDSQIVASIPLKAPRLGTFDWIEIEVTYCKDANA